MRSFLICSLLLLMPVVPRAQTLPGGSIHLAWDDCYHAGAGGIIDKDFACDSDAGSHELHASVNPPEGLTEYVGHLAVFELQAASPTMPLWWTFWSGGCRLPSSLTADPSPGATTCAALTDHPQFGGTDYAPVASSTSRARFRTLFAMDDRLVHPVATGVERTVVRIRLDHRGTTGPDACEGCRTPVCIVFQSLLLDQRDQSLPRAWVTSGEQQFVSWWGRQGVHCPGGWVPAEGRTWGQLKCLYR